jgi:uncharacterized protein YndB with AHSA1/START domain
MKPFTIERTYNAPVSLVWQALTNKDLMKKWYFDLAEFKPEIGFEFRFSGGPAEDRQYLHVCVVTESIVNKKIAYSWKYDGYKGISYVSFELFENGNQTRLKLTHEGLESFAANNNPDFDVKNFEAGWTSIIETSLEKFLKENQ